MQVFIWLTHSVHLVNGLGKQYLLAAFLRISVLYRRWQLHWDGVPRMGFSPCQTGKTSSNLMELLSSCGKAFAGNAFLYTTKQCFGVLQETHLSSTGAH